MKAKTLSMLLVGLVGTAAAAGVAAQSGGILDKAINTPAIAYTFYGAGYTAKVVKDAAVAGGQAYRVDVAAKGANAWDIGASSAIAKPIHAGDRVVMAVWLRAPKLKDGQTTPVPFIGVVGPAPGFAHVADGSADVTSEWKLYNARGVAPADMAPGQAAVALHLAAARAVIDLGPVFVLDLGKKTS